MRGFLVICSVVTAEALRTSRQDVCDIYENELDQCEPIVDECKAESAFLQAGSENGFCPGDDEYGSAFVQVRIGLHLRMDKGYTAPLLHDSTTRSDTPTASQRDGAFPQGISVDDLLKRKFDKDIEISRHRSDPPTVTPCTSAEVTHYLMGLLIGEPHMSFGFAGGHAVLLVADKYEAAATTTLVQYFLVSFL